MTILPKAINRNNLLLILLLFRIIVPLFCLLHSNCLYQIQNCSKIPNVSQSYQKNKKRSLSPGEHYYVIKHHNLSLHLSNLKFLS